MCSFAPNPCAKILCIVLTMCLQFYLQYAHNLLIILIIFLFGFVFCFICFSCHYYPFCFILDQELNMYTYDDVLNALHDLEKRNTKVLNIPFEENKLGKEQMIDEEVSYELDTKRYKIYVMSRDCNLRSKQESQNLRNILKRKCRKYK